MGLNVTAHDMHGCIGLHGEWMQVLIFKQVLGGLANVVMASESDSYILHTNDIQNAVFMMSITMI